MLDISDKVCGVCDYRSQPLVTAANVQWHGLAVGCRLLCRPLAFVSRARASALILTTGPLIFGLRPALTARTNLALRHHLELFPLP